MSRWLQDFAYRAGTGIWAFLLTELIVLFITFLTLSYKAIGAASANPVEAIKIE